jgi:hypothetical protein
MGNSARLHRVPVLDHRVREQDRVRPILVGHAIDLGGLDDAAPQQVLDAVGRRAAKQRNPCRRNFDVADAVGYYQLSNRHGPHPMCRAESRLRRSATIDDSAVCRVSIKPGNRKQLGMQWIRRAISADFFVQAKITETCPGDLDRGADLMTISTLRPRRVKQSSILVSEIPRNCPRSILDSLG